jgi:protoheme IX farnesyltransferase
MSGALLAAETRRSPGVVRDYLELSKSRIVMMVVLTTAAGFAIAGADLGFNWLLFLHTTIGTALVAAGTNALNQVIERDLDAKMFRTCHRPLPAGRMSPRAAMAFSVAISVIGTLYLALAVNALTALLGVITLGSYLFVYTPLKRKTSLSTIVGAVPGAIPPMMGWTAVTNSIDFGAWILFGILFVWQLPHFLAIGWMYREDYARGGFPILPVIDLTGALSGRQALLWSAALIPVSIAPSFIGTAGPAYLVGALVSGACMMITAAAFARLPSARTARKLFFASIIYLPAVMSLLVMSV